MNSTQPAAPPLAIVNEHIERANHAFDIHDLNKRLRLGQGAVGALSAAGLLTAAEMEEALGRLTDTCALRAELLTTQEAKVEALSNRLTARSMVKPYFARGRLDDVETTVTAPVNGTIVISAGSKSITLSRESATAMAYHVACALLATGPIKPTVHHKEKG